MVKNSAKADYVIIMIKNMQIIQAVYGLKLSRLLKGLFIHIRHLEGLLSTEDLVIIYYQKKTS